MKNNKMFLIRSLIFILITLCGVSLVYSAGEPARPENISMIGRVYKNSSDILFNGISVNEFILCNNCGGCSFEYCFSTPSGEVRSFLLNSEEKQVILSGKRISAPVNKLKEENPGSKCLKKLTEKDISFFSVEKAENISFYDYVIPDKINWDEPVKIKLHLQNPFEHQTILNVDLYSLDSHYKENHILKEKEERDIEIDFNLSKKDWARNFGVAIILEIKTSLKKADHVIYFSDKLAFYGPDGELVDPEE